VLLLLLLLFRHNRDNRQADPAILPRPLPIRPRTLCLFDDLGVGLAWGGGVGAQNEGKYRHRASPVGTAGGGGCGKFVPPPHSGLLSGVIGGVQSFNGKGSQQELSPLNDFQVLPPAIPSQVAAPASPGKV
jgi:hypothetical protein